MRNTKARLTSLLLAMMMLVALLVSTVSVHAVGDPYTYLVQSLIKGNYEYATGNKIIDVSKNRYAIQGGGYAMYLEVWNSAAVNQGGLTSTSNLFDDDVFSKLKAGAKQDFLKDVFTLANAMATDTQNGHYRTTVDEAPTDDTVADLMTVMQQQSGLGSAMLATLLQNTKPDYVSANRIYEPFSGVVGTILGIVSVLLMAALGVTMALDLAYITIPAFQMALGGTDNTGNGDKSKGIGGIISQEAKKAVQAADGGSGGQAGSGEYRAAVGIYFKYRWKGLVLLGICLLYLVQGQIYSFVAWFIDLFSGFLGF